MNKLIVIIGFAALVGVAAVFSVMNNSGSSSAPQSTPQSTAAIIKVKTEKSVVSEAKVVPTRHVALGFQASGVIVEVLVNTGDRVEAGKVLARLDTKQLDLQLAQADANLAAAQAALERLVKGDPNEAAAAKADLDKAKEFLDRVQAAYDRIGGNTRPDAALMPERAQLQSAWTDFYRAQARYNSAVQPTDASVRQAQANANSAKAARDLVADQLNRAKIVAPFAGTIASLNAKVGEQAQAGAPSIRLADLTAWEIETTDLTELNIARVRVGDAVAITFDALPELELTGTVARIESIGENKQGDIVYTVIIKPLQNDARLRWNMTAKVTLVSK